MTEQIINSACQHDCPDNCAMRTTVRDGQVVSVSGRKDHPFTRGVLCAKVRSFDQRVYSQERILFPQKRIGKKGEGRFERITWDAALKEISDRWRTIIDGVGPQAILPYNYLGSQGLLNGMHCGDPFFNRLGASLGERTFCNSGASPAFRLVCGPSGGLDPESFVHSKFIILWGINIVATSMHHWPFVKEAMDNGAQLVVIDPLRSQTAAKADWHLRPKPGTDVVLALALIQQLIEQNLLDTDYVTQHTVGFDDLKARAAQYSAANAAKLCGIDAGDIIKLANAYASSNASAIRTGVALERSRNGPDAVRAIACLPALTGAWREVGGGLFQHPQATFPIRRDRLTRPDFVEPERHVINLFGLADALEPGSLQPLKSLFVFNANPITAAADQSGVVKGLLRDDLFTVVSEVFETDVTDYADIVLPACTQLEQLDLMYSWGHFNLQLNEPAINPLGESVSNTELFRRLARVMNFDDADLLRTDEQLLEDSMDWTMPQLGDAGKKELKEQGFFRLNVGDSDQRAPHRNGQFPTPSGKCELACTVPEQGANMLEVYRRGVTDNAPHAPIDPVPVFIDDATDDTHPLVLLSPKTQHFLNSGYTNLGPASGYADRQPVWIHPDDAQRRSIRDGDAVAVFNSLGQVDGFARITEDTLSGVLVITHGYWRKHVGGATVNTLVHHRPAKIGQAPTINDTRVDVRVL